ncbi:MAG: ABC transporter permease, partial [Pseudomonadota bacterium]
MTDATATNAAGPAQTETHRSLWGDVWVQFRQHKGAMIGAGVFFFIVFAVAIGPFLWTIDPGQTNIRARNEPMSFA